MSVMQSLRNSGDQFGSLVEGESGL
jgi:hypothetical protein